MKEERKPEYPEKTLDDEFQKIPHTKPPKSNPNRDLKRHSMMMMVMMVMMMMMMMMMMIMMIKYSNFFMSIE